MTASILQFPSGLQDNSASVITLDDKMMILAGAMARQVIEHLARPTWLQTGVSDDGDGWAYLSSEITRALNWVDMVALAHFVKTSDDDYDAIFHIELHQTPRKISGVSLAEIFSVRQSRDTYQLAMALYSHHREVHDLQDHLSGTDEDAIVISRNRNHPAVSQAFDFDFIDWLIARIRNENKSIAETCHDYEGHHHGG